METSRRLRRGCRAAPVKASTTDWADKARTPMSESFLLFFQFGLLCYIFNILFFPVFLVINEIISVALYFMNDATLKK